MNRSSNRIEKISKGPIAKTAKVRIEDPAHLATALNYEKWLGRPDEFASSASTAGMADVGKSR
jgi:hypothetical protein